MMSTAARIAQRYLDLQPIRRTKLGECPVCEETVFADEKTSWRSFEGVPTRVHQGCLRPRYTLAFHPATNRHFAICSICKWRSEPQPTAGLAGSAFDEHAEEEHGS